MQQQAKSQTDAYGKSVDAADGHAVATSRKTAAETKYSLLEHVAT
jgi:hypothetical protein